MRPGLIGLLSAAMLSAAGGPPADSCVTVSGRDLDFMIGNWLVRDSTGTAIGTATVARAYASCVLIETRRAAGSGGGSLGVMGIDAESGMWHRDFLDGAGVVLSFTGTMEGSAMVMTGNEYRAEGVRRHQIRWMPRSDGTVEELWEMSHDAVSQSQVRRYGVFQRISE